MSLFDDEQYEVPIFRPPARRKSEGDARFKGEYPPEWKTCLDCEGTGYEVARLSEKERYGLMSNSSPEGDPPLSVMLRRKVPCLNCKGMGSVRGRVRLEADHRCIRCGHPYIPKGDAKMLGVEPSWREGGWSPCDHGCRHKGFLRARDAMFGQPEWVEYEDRDAEALVCGGFAVEAAWRVLTVHHADGDKANLRWWNLLSLCQRCHLYIQGKVVMERVYPFEHSEWFKPYVAGYYAWVYLDEELSREQTTERMDELLALELVA